MPFILHFTLFGSVSGQTPRPKTCSSPKSHASHQPKLHVDGPFTVFGWRPDPEELQWPSCPFVGPPQIVFASMLLPGEVERWCSLSAPSCQCGAPDAMPPLHVKLEDKEEAQVPGDPRERMPHLSPATLTCDRTGLQQGSARARGPPSVLAEGV